MHSNINIPMRLKSILQIFCKNGITGYYLGCLGTLYGIFRFYLQNVLFAITAYFLPFPDKNLWFSSQRRREGVVGDANGSISK